MGGTYRLYGLRQIPQSVDKEAHASFFYALGYLFVVPVSNYSSHNKSVDEKIFFYERIFIGDKDDKKEIARSFYGSALYY